jgi:hypothetical protein
MHTRKRSSPSGRPLSIGPPSDSLLVGYRTKSAISSICLGNIHHSLAPLENIGDIDQQIIGTRPQYQLYDFDSHVGNLCGPLRSCPFGGQD